MPPRLRLKPDRTKEEWRRLYQRCHHARLKQRYQAMFLSFSYSWNEVAAIVGRRADTVRDWVAAYNAGGLEALEPDAPPGAKPRLSEAQMLEVAEAVVTGPRRYGYPFNNWDTKTMSDFVQHRFSVTLKREATRELLHRIGFSWHKPEHRYALESVEEQRKFVKKLRRTRRRMKGAVLLFCDEATLNHHTTLHRAWLLRGKREAAKTFGTHAKRHVYAAVDRAGRIIHRTARKMRAVVFVEFLEQIRAAHPGKRILLVLDNGPIHKAKVVTAWFAAHPELAPLWLPKYAPRLNPVEQLWKELRAKVTHNRFFWIVEEMVAATGTFLAALPRAAVRQLCSMDYLLGLR